MNKKQKMEFVNETYTRFADAPNHGNGNNWWYPTANRIAYNVKMRSFGDVDTLRKSLTSVQNEYYSDDELQNAIYREQMDACEMLLEDLTGKTGMLVIESVTGAHFAGRSGGWVEVDYSVNFEPLDDDADTEDVDGYYRLAAELVKAEATVADFIANEHKRYNEYVDTPEYYRDIADSLLNDDAIKTEYTERVADLTRKINS